MAGLFDTLALGSRSLDTYRKAIDVTGHNLANVNTPGYTRQRLVLQSVAGTSDIGQVGGGVDIPVVAGVSVSGDFGLVGPTGDGIVRERSGYASFGNGRLLPFNASYRFNRHDAHQPWPFLTGGTGVIFGRRDAIVGGLNVGGGIDWWLRERRGVRVEVRDQLLEEFDGSHLVTLRVGFIFR